MAAYRFGTCEYCFPVWGSFALEMAHLAGFQGIQITDGGGYLQPHPKNNGFVEYERFGLDLRRKDSFPLTDQRVQAEYLETAERLGIELTGISLYLLDHQGFVKFASSTPQGQQCLETIRNAVTAAAQMRIPTVSIPLSGLFGAGQHAYALEKVQYAAQVGEEHGVQILVSADLDLEKQQRVLDALDGRVKLDFGAIEPALSANGQGADMLRAFGKEALGHLRVRDMTGDSEGFLTREEGHPALLGKGTAGFYDWASAAREIGWSGWVVSETPYYSTELNRDGQDWVSLASQDLTALKQAFHTDERRESHGEISICGL